MSPQLQGLPTELIRDVIEHRYAGSLDELAALCLVNSAVRSWVTPVLYRTVFLVSMRQFKSFALTCSMTRSVDQTHRLSIALPDAEPLVPGELDGILQQLPNLTNLRLRAPDMRHLVHSYPATHLCMSGTVRRSGWYSSAVAPHVTHLFVEDPCCASGLDTSRPSSVQRHFPALTHIAFIARPLEGTSQLVMIAQGFLDIPTVQRLTIIIIYNDEKQSAQMLPEVLRALRSNIRDPRAYIANLDAKELLPAEELKSRLRRV
ncbi:hypothetical protein AURDEDRAFT_168473 [Auricularia subglabra TFB-10046 SS5]|nr:hypothetical protein AURDEDRAFT_168473 [Auricularia subglabra TFB-10046 SS5]